eukprot:TRINITY_DN1739_c0_g4_i1.p1 TRINITY_DN1739_c0_g4~~TRINITY_DN1739_c0_g4_i1.p1  ORF type:complete len:360 (-),score=61.73 TRINITY_DN1739_c0_g4_i1:64-1143(-)
MHSSFGELRHRKKVDDEQRNSSSSLVESFKQLDLYPKIEDEHRVQTETGGLVTIISGFIILILLISEFSSYLSFTFKEDVEVDTTVSDQLFINFNITFPALSCSAAKLDVMDVTGDQILDVYKKISKQRLNSLGRPIGRELVAHEAANDHLVVKAPADFRGFAGRDREGCILSGTLVVNKVAGNFHVAVGESIVTGNRHVHNFKMSDLQTFNNSHIINHLSFGPGAPYPFPPLANPLDGTTNIVKQGTALYQYFVKLVPTVYVDTSGRSVFTNQFSVTEHAIPVDASQAHHLPGVFFMYELSPFMVRMTAQSEPLFQFITATCAIIGGVITIAGLFDSFLFHFSNIFSSSSNKVHSSKK